MAKGEKTGGRSKGTPNRSTSEIRELFKSLIEENLDTISEDLKTLKPELRIKFVLELSRFVIPTLKATELSTANGFEPIIISFTDDETDSYT